MGDIPIHFNLNLKTGFFKTEPYMVSVWQEELTFVSIDGDKWGERLIINCGDIKSVSICVGLPAELEIRTESEAYIGTFQKSANINIINEVLKVVFGKRFSII